MAISSQTATTLDAPTLERVNAFVARWEKAIGTEIQNSQPFFGELCQVLGVEPPNPQGGQLVYAFEHVIAIYTPSGKKTSGRIDFYKENHFVIESKQGSEKSGKATAKRGTQAYLKAMEGAFVQAIAYARNVPSKPPFVLTCDIGSHFELWMGFSGEYGGYGARREIGLAELRKPEIFELFVDIFTNPQARNPEKIAALVTREVAADLAELAKSLERSPLAPLAQGGTGEVRDPQVVAQFLMRCIFTMFAEDVGLLKEDLFTRALTERWLPNPKTFKTEVERLWQAMNLGEPFGFSDRLLRFNGGLFSEATAFELTAAQIEILLKAAKRDWRKVEPAIFGTLLERALDSRERSKLGAHYTPRSYVERLVRPVVLEPLRDRWEIVQAEVSAILGDGSEKLTDRQVTIRRNNAIALLEAFLVELRGVKVLDPACGSGNFLYVTLDLIKQLETEVFRRLADVTGSDQLRLEIEQVGPAQFLGIELNPRAAAIADLVIWIGYLQWHFKRFGDVPPIEPVLREYKNIECRDAVLAFDRTEPDVDKDGKVRTRWGGRMMKSPVTGEDVPDPTDQVTILKYINPRQAEWQEADYIVSNPPFIGNFEMRALLGDGYVETLRQSYADVPNTADFVMYWWHKAAELVRSTRAKRLGFITTKSIRQILQRKVIDFHINQKNSIRLFFAIAEHPWAEGDAAVTIAMTAAELRDPKKDSIASLGYFIPKEKEDGESLAPMSDQDEFVFKQVGAIFSNLKNGINITNIPKLKANSLLSCPGVKLHGKGFKLNSEQLRTIEPQVVYPYLNWDDLTDKSRNLSIIDLFGLSESEVRLNYPNAYQWVYENVKPDRDQNNRPTYKNNWWIFGEPRAQFRPAIKDLSRYIVTGETSKHRTFMFLSGNVVPDNMLTVFAFDNAYELGILSSKLHEVWALASGGDHSGNTPRYNKSVCFDPFPFPDPNESQKQKIRELGDRLDSHRKRVQAAHPEVTITAMYNLLEKLRKGEPLDDKDKAFNQKALVSTLKQIHDELDIAVFEAYGWQDLENTEVGSENVEEMILERLVKLNAERAQEEANGLIRWLRPDYQAPTTVQSTQTELGILPETPTPVIPATQQKLPKDFKDQLAAIRDLLRTQGGEWTLAAIVQQFKNASRSESKIQDALDALETLGIVTKHTEDSPITWYFTELQTVRPID